MMSRLTIEYPVPKATSGFIAYPAEPKDIGDAMREAVALSTSVRLRLFPWESINVVGLRIDDEVRERIRAADVILADITFPNFNVFYELGFALALEKPIIPLLNSSFVDAVQRVQTIGLFDTMGWVSYENSKDLLQQLESWEEKSWVGKLKKERNHSQPLFVLDTQVKNNNRNYIFNAVLNSKVNNRVFDPSDNPRLTTAHAIGEISSSSGVVLSLQKADLVNSRQNNLRAAFLAGLSHGFGIKTMIIQFDNGPAPLDYRDSVTNSASKVETERHIEGYCQEVLIENQKTSGLSRKSNLGLISKIDLGNSFAEGEGQQLSEYFVSTAEFARAVRSDGCLIVGRKGSGKSAIAIRSASEFARETGNLVIDLRPAAHNLSDMREQLLSKVGQGLFDHTIASFWQYVVLYELLLGARERALLRSKNDFSLQETLRDIEARFGMTGDFVSGDFTSRLDITVKSVIDVLAENPTSEDIRQRITNNMYEKVIPALRESFISLGAFYDDVIIVLDDLDKGWPPRKLESYDVRLLRILIEILKKIQRDFRKPDISAKYMMCLRSDVYDVLVDDTADRGKDTVIEVDWSDREQLIHLIRQRVLSSFDGPEGDEAWEAFNPVMPDGRAAIDHLIDSSLFRPRFLIEVCERVLSAAVSRGHSFVQEVDVQHGMNEMSLYLVSDFANEMRTVAGTPADIFYAFIGTTGLLTHAEVVDRIAEKLPDLDTEFVVDLLIWYGFLGVVGMGDQPIFIYDRSYDFDRLIAERPVKVADRLYVVNHAFLSGLRQG